MHSCPRSDQYRRAATHDPNIIIKGNIIIIIKGNIIIIIKGNIKGNIIIIKGIMKGNIIIIKGNAPAQVLPTTQETSST